MANLLTIEEQHGPALNDITPEERVRLLRYCAQFTSDLDTAEDLVQQTLLEAWQHGTRLYTAELRGQWLIGVARNICRRWLRSQGRDASRRASLTSINDQQELPVDRALVDPGDPFAEIERRDLVDLLDHALELLPPATRAVLAGRYIEGLSQAELASRLGVSEGAVEARLQRGKLALRGLLTTKFREQLVAYGVAAPEPGQWQATRIWCATCGRHRLMAQFPLPPGSLAFRCPGCQPDPTMTRAEFRLANSQFMQLIDGVSSPRAVLNRLTTWVHSYFTQGLAAGWVSCTNCGHRTQLQIEPQSTSARWAALSSRMLAICPMCEEAVSSSFAGMVEALPPVQRFWRQHDRMRMLPPYEVEANGQAALVTRFESVTASAGLTIVVTHEPFRLLHVGGDLSAPEDH